MRAVTERAGEQPTAVAGTRPRLLTLEVDDYGLEEFLSVAAAYGDKAYGYVATPNVDGLIRLCESEPFHAAYARAAYVLLDSRVAAALFRVTHGLRIPVCPGSDLTAALFARLIRPDDRIVLIGSTEPQAAQVRERFGLRQLLHLNPPMGFINDPAAVEACLKFVEAASPFRFCLFAVGDPQGTLIAHRLAERGRARGLGLIVGASIDFITGKQQRAPAWMQRLLLEWLYRLLREPRRLARRYLLRGPRFLFYLPRSRVVLRPVRRAD